MENYIIKKTKSKETGKAELLFEGQLVVLNSHEIKSNLDTMELDEKELVIKLERVDDIDLSFIQIIKAFEITKAKEGISIHYEFNINSDLQLLLTQTGVLATLSK